MKNILFKGLLTLICCVYLTTSASALTCTILTRAQAQGGENSEVLALQQFLYESGYLTAKPNGYFGSGTFKAVKAFQKANGLAQVGSIGPGTRAKIKALSCITSQNNSNTTTGTTSSTPPKSTSTASSVPKVSEQTRVDMVTTSACGVESKNEKCVLDRFAHHLETCSTFSHTETASTTKLSSVTVIAINGEQGNRCKTSLTLESSSKTSNRKVKHTASCLLAKDESKSYKTLLLPLAATVQGYVEGEKTLVALEKLFGTTQNSLSATEHACVYSFKDGLLSVSNIEMERGQMLRDSQRKKDVNTILNAVSQYLVDSNGLLPAGVTVSPTEICASTAPSCVGLVDLSVLTRSSKYLVSIPDEPQKVNTNGAGYLISKTSSGRITISSQYAEGGAISISWQNR